LRSDALHIPPEHRFVIFSESFGDSVDFKKIDTFYTKYKTCGNRNITPNPALKLIVTNNDPKYVFKIMSECLTILNEKPIINTHHQQMVIEILAASLPGFLDKYEKEENDLLGKIKEQRFTIFYCKLWIGAMISFSALIYLFDRMLKYHII
jgi:hypothetical protein